MQLFDLINPILHATAESVETYQVEPYVIPADVYSIAPHEGRGGWTWYTGSAAWAYRVAIESILGFKLQNGKVTFKPCVPSDWNEFEFYYRNLEKAERYLINTKDHTSDNYVISQVTVSHDRVDTV